MEKNLIDINNIQYFWDAYYTLPPNKNKSKLYALLSFNKMKYNKTL